MEKTASPICIALLVIILNGCATTTIFDASREGDIAAVRKLLSDNKNVNITNRGGVTPLMLAARNGHEKIANLLINKGADVNVSDTANYTPLLNAMFSNSINIVKLLIENGAKVNQCSEYSRHTPLIYAAKSTYNPELVQLLIDKGADVNAVCGRQVPLSVAGDVKVAETLIKNGAYVNLPANSKFKGSTPPLLGALKRAKVDVVKVLLAHGAKKPKNWAWLIVPHNVDVTFAGIKRPQHAPKRLFRLPAGRYTFLATYHYKDKFSRMFNRRPDPTTDGDAISLNINPENGKIYVLALRLYEKRGYWKAWIEEVN